MATPEKYKPSQKVYLGPGRDSVNDFARKYNLELDEIFNILNLRSARQVYFKHDSVHWTAITNGYKLTIPHNGNVVFGVYSTDYTTGKSTQVSVGVSMSSTNVEIVADEKFDGFLIYAGLNDGAGMGSNLSDDVIEQLILDTRSQFASHLTDAENFAEAASAFTKASGSDHETLHYSAKHYSDAAAASYQALLAVNNPTYLQGVIDLLEEWTATITDGVWETDAYGGLMPKLNPSPLEEDEWELDTNNDITPA